MRVEVRNVHSSFRVRAVSDVEGAVDDRIDEEPEGFPYTVLPGGRTKASEET
jgi:hypothetical protein